MRLLEKMYMLVYLGSSLRLSRCSLSLHSSFWIGSFPTFT
jgi:hypothetical protein